MLTVLDGIAWRDVLVSFLNVFFFLSSSKLTEHFLVLRHDLPPNLFMPILEFSSYYLLLYLWYQFVRAAKTKHYIIYSETEHQPRWDA